MSLWKILATLAVLYITCVFLWACIWLLASKADHDACGINLTNIGDSFYFALITFSTIGYGAASSMDLSCARVSFIILGEVLCSIVVQALIVGTIYGKLQRGSPRGSSVCFSKKACMRTIRNSSFFTFRVVESRKLQILECHVRVYAIFHGPGQNRSSGKHVMFQHRVCRLAQPDDQINGWLLLMLPNVVVHQLDAWSPLLPPSCQPRRNRDTRKPHDPMCGYKWPEMEQRQMDATSGNRSLINCAATGETFNSEWTHQAHHATDRLDHDEWCAEGKCCHDTFYGHKPLHTIKRRTSCGSGGTLDSCGSIVSAETDAAVEDEEETDLRSGLFTSTAPDEATFRQWMKDTNMEILVVVEGVEATHSCTIQCAYSYREPDIAWDMEYDNCTSADENGRCVVDLEKFHDMVPCTKTQ